MRLRGAKQKLFYYLAGGQLLCSPVSLNCDFKIFLVSALLYYYYDY